MGDYRCVTWEKKVTSRTSLKEPMLVIREEFATFEMLHILRDKEKNSLETEEVKAIG